MYPIYCLHPTIEKRMTDAGDLIINCIACPAVEMWHRSNIPPISQQILPRWLIGVLKTGIFSTDRIKIYIPFESLKDFEKNQLKYVIEQINRKE